MSCDPVLKDEFFDLALMLNDILGVHGDSFRVFSLEGMFFMRREMGGALPVLENDL